MNDSPGEARLAAMPVDLEDLRQAAEKVRAEIAETERQVEADRLDADEE